MSELTVQYLVLERCDPARNMARFYVLTIEPTLFGDTALVREWGRLGQRGRRRLDLFAGRVQAVEALEAWLVRKTRRGYVRRNSTASVNRPVHRDIARLEMRHPGLGIPRRDHSRHDAAQHYVAAEPSLHRCHPRKAAGCTGRPEEGRRHRGTQYLGPAAMVETGRVAASRAARLTANRHGGLSHDYETPTEERVISRQL